MDYTTYDRDRLLDEQHQEARLSYAWGGNLGHWYWNIDTICNPLKVERIGFKLSDLPKHLNHQFFTDRVHPEDYGRVMQVMRDHLGGKAASYSRILD